MPGPNLGHGHTQETVAPSVEPIWKQRWRYSGVNRAPGKQLGANTFVLWGDIAVLTFTTFNWRGLLWEHNCGICGSAFALAYNYTKEIETLDDGKRPTRDKIQDATYSLLLST